MFYLELGSSVADESELCTVLRSLDFVNRSIPERIEERNREIAGLERIARGYIAAGRSREEFSRDTGHWAGFYDMLVQGGSYLV